MPEGLSRKRKVHGGHAQGLCYTDDTWIYETIESSADRNSVTRTILNYCIQEIQQLIQK